jgi:hypothetical protein
VREPLQQLKGEGLELVLDGDDLVVRAPGPLDGELLRLIREHKAEFVSALKGARHQLKGQEQIASAACARVHVCATCCHFEFRSPARPDGWCRQFCTETWSAIPRGGGYVDRRQ